MNYWMLRVCERFGLEEEEFRDRAYEWQMRYLAYEMLRDEESAGISAQI